MNLRTANCVLLALLSLWSCAPLPAEALSVNETPARPGEWGFRPLDAQHSRVDPPGSVWRPQRGAVSYELQCARDRSFKKVRYRAAGVRYNCHCPPEALGQGRWHWRFRFVDAKGRASGWSKVRSFVIGPGAVAFPMPRRRELLGRIPRTHPRLFVRPGQLPHLRKPGQKRGQEPFFRHARPSRSISFDGSNLRHGRHEERGKGS